MSVSQIRDTQQEIKLTLLLIRQSTENNVTVKKLLNEVEVKLDIITNQAIKSIKEMNTIRSILLK